MELCWIEDFLALVDLQHFTLAAARRCTTQPAFSRRLQRLEAWLGCPLIDRGHHPFALTPEGKAFLPRAQRLREDMMDARRALTALSSHYDRAERLYTTNTLAIGFLPDWVRQQQLSRYSLVVASITGCLEALRAGRASLALIPLLGIEETALAAFDVKIVGQDCLHLYAMPALANQIKLERHALSGPFLLFAPGTGYGAAISARLQHLGLRLTAPPACESASAEALAAAVRGGLGAAFIPESLAPKGSRRCLSHHGLDVPYAIALCRAKEGSKSAAERGVSTPK